MKVLIIGGAGTVGRCVHKRLQDSHEVIVASRTSGDETVDMTDESSIENLFQRVDNLDAVVCTAGDAKWDLMDKMSSADFEIGLKSKLMGQVNVARIARNHLNKSGSVTLTSGILADDPVSMTTSAAMVNGALHSFVKAAALEPRNEIRINVVSAGLVVDAAEKYADYFPGHTPVPMNVVADAYAKCVLGMLNGQVVRVY